MLRLKYSALVEVVLALFATLLVVVAVMMFTPGVGNCEGEHSSLTDKCFPSGSADSYAALAG